MVLVHQFYSSVLAADEIISVSGEEDSVPSLLVNVNTEAFFVSVMR